MTDDWPELERARLQREAQLERQRMERSAAALPDTMESRIERALAVQALEARLGPYQEQMFELAKTWDPQVKPLLEQVAISTWGDSPDQRVRWSVEGKIIWRPESQTPSLYWEALFAQLRYMGWYGVELRTDLQVRPLRFVITCNEADYTISTSLNAGALKSGLVQAFRLGPLDNIFHAEIPGVRI